MKKCLIASVIFLMFGLASCGTKGWTKTGEDNLRKSCEKKGTLDCECYVSKVKAKYPNQVDFNKSGGKDEELKADVFANCALN